MQCEQTSFETMILQYFARPYHRDFLLLFQNDSVILKMDSCPFQRNKRNMLYDCRDIGGFLK